MSSLTSSCRTSAASASSKASRRSRSCLAVRAQDTKKATNEGTQLLKGLPRLGTGTLSLKQGQTNTGTQKIGTGFLSALTGTIGRSAPSKAGDAKTVYVAGATGRTGARVVRELLKAGFKVRAGARNVETAQQALDVAEQYGLLTSQEARAVQVVQVDYSSSESIRAALGPARKVVSALGASEAQPLNFSEPKKVDYEHTTALINAAVASGVQQFVLVTSLGTGKIGFPASVLNLFGGILYWKREAEKALEASGLSYTIVRPGGMERPTDTHKRTHNMILSPKDTTFGGTVSRLQVAELIGTILINPELAENKVLEVTSETTAPRATYQELLSGIRSDVTREEQEAAREAAQEAAQQLQEAEGRAEQARSQLAAADARVKELNDRLKAAKAQEGEVKSKVAPVLKEGAAAEKALQAATAAADKAALQESAARAVLDAAKRAASQGQLLDKKQLKQVADEVLNPPPAPAKSSEPAQAAAGSSASPPPLFGFLTGSMAPRTPTPAPPPAPAAVKAATPPAPAAPAAAPKAPPAAAKPPAAPAAPPAPAEKPAQRGFNLASLFGIPDAAPVQVDPGVAAKAPSPPPRGAPAAPPAAAPKQAAAEPAPAPKAAPPAPAPAAAPKPVPAAAAAPAPPKPAAAEAPKPAPAPPKPAAPAKPSVPVESPAEVERRALAALAEERRQVALQAAKARLEAEAKALEASRAAAAKAAQQKAPSPEPAPAKPGPAKPAPAAPAPAKAAAVPANVAAAKPSAKLDAPDEASIAAEKKKVQAWIAAWQARKQSGVAVSPSSNGTTPAAKPSNGVVKQPSGGPQYDEEAAKKAKAEAQKWIAAWQQKQKASVKA